MSKKNEVYRKWVTISKKYDEMSAHPGTKNSVTGYKFGIFDLIHDWMAIRGVYRQPEKTIELRGMAAELMFMLFPKNNAIFCLFFGREI